MLVDEIRTDWRVSIRRACGLIRFDPQTYRYKFRQPALSCDQAALEQRIKEICETRVRFGYRRVHVLLRREGWEINAKKTYRVYKELGMQLRNKTPKRPVKAKLREDRKEAVAANLGVGVILSKEVGSDRRLKALRFREEVLEGLVYAVALEESSELPTIKAFFNTYGQSG